VTRSGLTSASPASLTASASSIATHAPEIHHSLPENFYWSVVAAGQTPFNKPMLTSEQFDLTGSRALSGFTSGALPGDRGWVVRGEFGQTPAPISAIAVIPYLFGAIGERTLERPTILEFTRLGAVNYGAGTRLNISPSPDLPETYAFVEWSRRKVDRDPRLDGDRIFTGIVIRY
jgi:hemolysin activation/secretion protein